MKITDTRHRYGVFDVGRADQIAYIVIDHRPIVVEANGVDVDAIIVSLRQNNKELSTPYTDVLFCLSPSVLGRLGVVGEYRAILPSVICWREKFWVPFLNIVPSVEQIAHDLQLAGVVFRASPGGVPEGPYDGTSNVDVIYEVDKVVVPELDWELFNH